MGKKERSNVNEKRRAPTPKVKHWVYGYKCFLTVIVFMAVEVYIICGFMEEKYN